MGFWLGHFRFMVVSSKVFVMCPKAIDGAADQDFPPGPGSLWQSRRRMGIAGLLN